jgi:hypothetical protein
LWYSSSREPFTNNEKIREVLSDIEEISCTFSEIDKDTNEIDLVWLSQNKVPDYVFDTGDYTDLGVDKLFMELLIL